VSNEKESDGKEKNQEKERTLLETNTRDFKKGYEELS